MEQEPLPVVCARPVDWSDIGWSMEKVYEVERQTHAANPGIQSDHNPLSGVYPDSVVRPCAACGVRCWVPPRSLTLVDQGVLVGCYRCVFMTGNSIAGLASLGNPESARRMKSD